VRQDLPWPEARMINVWDAPRKERIRVAFLATRLPYASDTFAATASKIDHYIQDWQAMHADACQVTPRSACASAFFERARRYARERGTAEPAYI
jgi:hypothetical protein